MSISTKDSPALIYAEILDDIDWLLENDTTIKGVMSQRLQACRVWFSNALKLDKPSDSEATRMYNKYSKPGVTFKFKVDSPIPRFLSKEQLQSAIVPILDDNGIGGLIVYQGFDEGGGYYNYYLSGMCPIHKRVHDGQAWKWVLKVKQDKTWAGFKCWRDDSFHKIVCIEQLLP